MALLLVDDDPTGRRVAIYNLTRAGFEVDEAGDGEEALTRFDPERHLVVITDLKMPRMDGMALLAALRARAPAVPVIVITAFGAVDTAVSAMQAGAWDFVEKPFSRDRLELTVRRAVETATLRRDVRRLGGVERPIVARSAGMVAALALADRVAPSEATVLITGESGVGKELVARRIHARSARGAGPFVAINCAAIPETLLESELFGHTRGAFSGADRAREGRVRQAQGGTLFLDEVADLPQPLQAKLLRLLQEREIDVVGADRPVSADVRVLAATNADLRAAVGQGRFRQDLFFRLAVIELEVPPLRERLDDIEPLARAFLTEAGRTLELPDEVVDALRRRTWPGNVRELKNAVERLAILAPGDRVRAGDLPEAGPSVSGAWLDAIPESLSLIDVEREVVRHALTRAGWNVSEAARRLGVPRHVLVYRIEKYGLRRDA